MYEVVAGAQPTIPLFDGVDLKVLRPTTCTKYVPLHRSLKFDTEALQKLSDTDWWLPALRTAALTNCSPRKPSLKLG